MVDLKTMTKEELIAELIKTRQMIDNLEQNNQKLIQEIQLCKNKINRLVKAKDRALRLAEIDHLTGLLNRRSFIKRLESELNRSKRAGIPISIIFTDIDHFKQINDIYGHLVGDLVLRNFAKFLVKLCRSYDLICRYGGEEFLICLPATTGEQALKIARRINRALADWYVLLPETNEKITLTSSFGVTTSTNEEGETVKSLLEKVDYALYKAKLNGRNRVECC